MNDIITLFNITRKFGDLTVLDSIKFSVKKGDFVGLVGPNGAGKTTLMKILCGLLIPSSFEKIDVLGFNSMTNSKDLISKRK